MAGRALFQSSPNLLVGCSLDSAAGHAFSILTQPLGWVQFLYLVFLSARRESLTCKSSYHEYPLHHQGAGEVNHIAWAVLLDPLLAGCRLSLQPCEGNSVRKVDFVQRDGVISESSGRLDVVIPLDVDSFKEAVCLGHCPGGCRG